MVASITSCSENTPSTRQCERRFPGTGSAKLPAVRPPSGTAGRTSPFLRECFYQPVRPSGLSPDIEAGDERAAGLQNAPCFAKRFLLVGERVEAVHADDEIKGFAGHLQLPHIALYALNMRISPPQRHQRLLCGHVPADLQRRYLPPHGKLLLQGRD